MGVYVPRDINFEGRRVINFRGITLGCDTDPKDGVEDKIPR